MDKGLIFDIQRYCVDDGVGIRTVVFFKGCPLRCKWCHNPEGVTEKDCYADGSKIAHNMTVDEVFSQIVKDKKYYELTGGGVTLSGGEVAVQAEFASKLLFKCREEGINSVVETSGYCIRKSIEILCKNADCVYYDIKLLDGEKFKKYTGGELDIVLNNLDYLYSMGKKIVLRCPIIGGVNDNEEHFKGIAKLLSEYSDISEVHLLPYNDLLKDKYGKCGLIYGEKFYVPGKEIMNKGKEIIGGNFKAKVRCLNE